MLPKNVSPGKFRVLYYHEFNLLYLLNSVRSIGWEKLLLFFFSFDEKTEKKMTSKFFLISLASNLSNGVIWRSLLAAFICDWSYQKSFCRLFKDLFVSFLCVFKRQIFDRRLNRRLLQEKYSKHATYNTADWCLVLVKNWKTLLSCLSSG